MMSVALQDHAVRTGNPILVAGRLLIVLLLFTISANALIALGWQYDDTGGGPVEKLHPATWLAIGLFGIKILLEGNPLSALIRQFERDINVLVYFLGIMFMLVYATRVMGLPFTIFFETFLGPLALFLLFREMGEQEAHRLALLIHFLMLCNALLGIYEFAFSYRLTPLIVNGEELQDELRSTALLGHPLANAALVGCYLLIMVLGGRRDLPSLVGLALFTINAASVIVFGGRAATGLVIIAVGLVGLRRLYDIARGAPVRLHMIRVALIAVPIYAVAIAVLAEYGYFDMFLDRFKDDEGSASTRLALFSLFEHMSWFEFFFVPDTAEIATWSNIHGLNYGIENFVVAFILSYGLLATLIFLPTLLLFCKAVASALQPKVIWVWVYFFAVALTSVSLSAKSPILSVLVVMLMVLMRRRPEDEAQETDEED